MAKTYDILRKDPDLLDKLKNQIYDGLYVAIEEKRVRAKAKLQAEAEPADTPDLDPINDAVSEALDDDDGITTV
jgi:hypothetical protein